MEKNNYKINHHDRWLAVLKNNNLLYPSEHVARFLGRRYSNMTFDECNKIKALDIGFGTGRNLRALLDYNFQVYGIDFVKESCDTCINVFNNYKNIKEIIFGDYEVYDFKAKYFDLILCYGVIFFGMLDNIKSNIGKIYDILQDNGRMLINFRSKEDFLYKNGEQIDNNSYILSHEIYKGLLFSFFDYNEAEKLLLDSGFKIDYVEREDYYKNNMNEKHSWYIFSVYK